MLKMEHARRKFHKEVSALNESFENKLKLRNIIEARLEVENRVSALLVQMQSIGKSEVRSPFLVVLLFSCC